MESGEEPDTGPDIVKMRALGITALTVTLIVSFVTPYALLNYIGEPLPYPRPPGWPTHIWLYLQGAFSVNVGFLEWYKTDGLGLSLYDSALFWVLSLIAALQFLHPTWDRKRLAVHLVVLIFSLTAWILCAHAIYGDMDDYAVIPIPITPVVALVALLLICISSRSE
ncbi:hypothetical protein EU546_02890 [Candidatus Thorarchaeota archaeon]|nr:MAG: hypothetical protein EU546_02890 [Candidatus Thorarchaeota archaeon]